MKDYLNAEELAAKLNVDKQTIRLWGRHCVRGFPAGVKKRIKSKSSWKAWYWTAESIEEWFRNRKNSLIYRATPTWQVTVNGTSAFLNRLKSGTRVDSISTEKRAQYRTGRR